MAQSKGNKKNNKKINNKGIIKLALIVVFILIIIIFISSRNNQKISKYEKTQIILDNVNITSNLQDEIIVQNGKIYMGIDDIKTFLDDTIYEEETGLIITTSKLKTATLSLNNTENITINSSNQKIEKAVIEDNGKKYIAISELEKVYNYEFMYIQDTNIATIDNLNKELITAEAKKNITVKEKNEMFSKTVEKVKKGETVVCIDEENGKTMIRTQNGNIGYVRTSKLINKTTQRENFDEMTSRDLTKEAFTYDITKKDISTFEKREEVINLILQELIKNDNMYVKFEYNGDENFYFERFKIEAAPVMQECGITVDM